VFLILAPVVEGQGHSRKSKTISGTLSPGSLTAGSSVKLSGSASATTVADGNGNYSFTVAGNGSYTVTPSKTGITFQPASQTVSLNGSSNVVVNFTATPMLESIAVSAAAASIAKGSSDQFTAIGTFSDGATQNLTGSVTWVSSNTAVATVSGTGLATGIGAGSASISATQGSIASNAVVLAVTGPTLQSISVSAPSASLASGSSEQITATGTFSDGSSQNLTASAAWSSSNSAAISLSSTAMALAAGVGQSMISASQGGITGALALSGTANISGTVTPASSAAGTSVALGGTANATTTADGNGNYSFTVSANGAYTVTPSKASYGFAPSNVSVTVSNANVGGVNFTVTTGQLGMTPASFSFGNVNVGVTSQITATLTASGGDVTVTGDTITGSGFGFNGLTFPTTIAVGTSASFNVTFTPASTGSASGTISLVNNTTTLSTANLSGSGAGLSVSPSNLTFGQVLDGAASSPQMLILNAVGNGLTITSDNISQNGGGGSAFSIAGLPAMPFTLSAGQSAQASVTFAPSSGSPGTAAGTVTFVSNMNSAASTMSGTGASNVGLAWTASTTPGVTYNVYRCAVSAAACVSSQPANFSPIARGITGLAYTDSTVFSGQTYYYALTAVDTSNTESLLSVVSTAAIP